MANFLIVGCGDIGSAVALALVEAGHEVTGVRRHLPETSGPFPIIAADLTDRDSLNNINTSVEYVLLVVTPDKRSEAAYRKIFQRGVDKLLEYFNQANSSATFLFVSSSSVYGQSNGEWVDEDTPAKPENYRGEIILYAERAIMAQNRRNVVIRFSGIYGRGGQRMLEMAQNGSLVQFEPPYFTNRIHRSDCIGAILFLFEKLMARQTLDSIYLGSDNDPAPIWDVVCWIAEQLDKPPPGKKLVGDTSGQNKRISNSRLRKLGYQFQIPSYRQGYKIRE